MDRVQGNAGRRWIWTGVGALIFLAVTLLLLVSASDNDEWTFVLATIHLPAQILLYDVDAIDGGMIAFVVVLYILELALVMTIIYGATEAYLRLRAALQETK
ncbi:MAG: hypothetical protein ABI432_09745 [Flavobacteriales bacterium]